MDSGEIFLIETFDSFIGFPLIRMQIIADFLNKVNMTRECHIISILKIRAEAF